MGLGDITATSEYTGFINSAAFLAELNTLNTGAATAGTDISSIVIVSHGNGQATIFKLVRAAA